MTTNDERRARIQQLERQMELDEERAALRQLHVSACRLTKEEARDLIVRQARAEGRSCLSTAATEALEGHEGFEGSRLEGRS